jgi:DNA-binding response OmpR family regulator
VKFDDIHLVLADGRAHLRSTLRMALNEAGIEHIHNAAEASALAEAVAKPDEAPDVIVCDADLRGGDAAETVHAIRNGELGRNPFVCVLALAWTATQDTVTRLVNAGADHVVAGPIAPQKVIDRIEAMIHRRKPFVVTADYVGPDRRLVPGREANGAPLVDVPNSLREKALGLWDPEAMSRAIHDTTSAMTSHRIEREATALSDTIDATLSAEPGAISRIHLERLIRLAQSLGRRAQASAAPHISELCDSARLVAERLLAGAQTNLNDQELLAHVALALRAATRPQENAAVAREIAATIGARRTG